MSQMRYSVKGLSLKKHEYTALDLPCPCQDQFRLGPERIASSPAPPSLFSFEFLSWLQSKREIIAH